MAGDAGASSPVEMGRWSPPELTPQMWLPYPLVLFSSSIPLAGSHLSAIPPTSVLRMTTSPSLSEPHAGASPALAAKSDLADYDVGRARIGDRS